MLGPLSLTFALCVFILAVLWSQVWLGEGMAGNVSQEFNLDSYALMATRNHNDHYYHDNYHHHPKLPFSKSPPPMTLAGFQSCTGCTYCVSIGFGNHGEHNNPNDVSKIDQNETLSLDLHEPMTTICVTFCDGFMMILDHVILKCNIPSATLGTVPGEQQWFVLHQGNSDAGGERTLLNRGGWCLKWTTVSSTIGWC